MHEDAAVFVAAATEQVTNDKAYLRELAYKVLKTNESLERARKACFESLKLLAELRSPEHAERDRARSPDA